MAESPTLFDTSWRPVENVAGLSRYGDPQTSKEAAASITGRTEQAILAEFRMGRIEGDDGCTDDELCRRLPRIFPPTVKSARSRLSNKALLVDSGKTRLSRQGRSQIVWALPLNASGPK